ncbi:MAG: TonB family protein [Pyrinomonadaceae bacterium]
MTPGAHVSSTVRVSILERLVPSLAFSIAAISGAVGGAMVLRFLDTLRHSESAGLAAFFGGVAEVEFVVGAVLIFAAVLCAIGILVSIIRLFTTNKTASPPGLLFLMTGLLSLVPPFALHYVVRLMKEVVQSQTDGGISAIAGTINAVTWFAIGSAGVIALVLLVFSFIPFSSHAGRKSSPLICLIVVEILLAVLIGIYFWDARGSIVERDLDRDSPSSSYDYSDANTGDSGVPMDAYNTDRGAVERNSNSPGKTISGGVLNDKAINLPQPAYPAAARAVRAAGAVTVQVLVDENGDVISATALSGHPLLRSAAVQAARQARFAPATLARQPVKVNGVLTFNFSAP